MITFFIYTTRILFLGIFIWLMIKGAMVQWLGIFGVTLLLALFFGRLFCGWICPMNTIMIPTEWLSNKLNLQAKYVPKWLESKALPWAIVTILLLTMMILKKLFQIEVPVLLYVLLFSVIVTVRYKSKVFHNNICPFGLIQSFAGRIALLTEQVNYDKCIGCKLCESVCSPKAIIVSKQGKKANINSTLCHQCFNCQQICPRDAIHYQKRKERKLIKEYSKGLSN